MQNEIDVPGDVTVEVDGDTVSVSDGDTTVDKTLDHPAVDIRVEDGTVVVGADSERRDVKAMVGTYTAHVRNMVDGVTGGYEYHMQGFYNHFPMDLAVEGDEFVISNFIGEREPRRIPIPDQIEVEVDGEDVIVRGPDKDAVGQTAARIEQACTKGKRDPRKFQDGVYLTERRTISDE